MAKANKTPQQDEQEAPKQEDKATQQEAPKGDRMVKVHNPQRFGYVQPSSQVRIAPGDTAKLVDDSWLQAQIDGGVLKAE